MATLSARRELAAKIIGKSKHHAQASRQLHRAVVKRTRPLTVELIAHAIALDDGDFQISYCAQTFMAANRLRIGDVVLMAEESGDWVMVDVLKASSATGPSNAQLVAQVAALTRQVNALAAGGGQALAGGGQRTFYELETISIASGWAQAHLVPPTDGSHDDDLLDLTNDTAPKPFVDGIYAVAVSVRTFPVPGKIMGLSLQLDAYNDDVTLVQYASISESISGSDIPQISVSGTYFIPAGSPILVQVGHNVGVAHNVFGRMSVIRLG